jgi:hypothetical protein
MEVAKRLQLHMPEETLLELDPIILLDLDPIIVKPIIETTILVDELSLPQARVPTERHLVLIQTPFTTLGAMYHLVIPKVRTVDHAATRRSITNASVPWRWAAEDTLRTTTLLLDPIRIMIPAILMPHDMPLDAIHVILTLRLHRLGVIPLVIRMIVATSDTNKICTTEEEGIPLCCPRTMDQDHFLDHTIDLDTRASESRTTQERRTMRCDALRTIFDMVPHTHLLNVITLTHAVRQRVLPELTLLVCRMIALQIDCGSMA